MENATLNRSYHPSGATSQFKFEFLKHITNDFSKDRIIGSGAYGVVYKGVMDNGETIAVKKLNYMPPDHDSEKQFHNECINLMRVQHPNIVRLVGYCDETHRRCIKYDGEFVFADENERALCFEYLQGGSLDKHVADEPCRLDWDTCYRIIKGVCVGLNHLHNGYKDSIFHLDLKPANILLDNNMIPKIGDFGLSRLFSTTETCTTTTPLGTRGYTPPEYVDKQEISPKYDVFSLGVVIIHIMAGRKHYYNHVDTPSKIIELVCENWGKRLHTTMWSHGSREVKTCIEIALTCVESDRKKRLTIRQIVDELNRIDVAKLPLTHEATNLQSRETLDYNQYTNSVLMGVHDDTTRFDSMLGIDYIPALLDEVGGKDRSMHGSMYHGAVDPMDYVQESIIRDPVSLAIGGHASRAISEHRYVHKTTEVGILNVGHLKRNPHLSGANLVWAINGAEWVLSFIYVSSHIAQDAGVSSLVCLGTNRAEGNYTPVTMDTIGNLFQWARSTISSQWSGTVRKRLHQELFCLETGLQYLMDTLPAMYDLIDRAEWRSHKHRVAELLPNLKDAVYDADDLLDEFRWYMLNVKVEGNGSQSLSRDFFDSVIQGSFIKSVNGIRDRLDNISTRLLNMGLHEVSTRFDKSVRPETSSFPNEENFIGREMELKKIIEFLCPPPKCWEGNNAVVVSTSTSASNQVSCDSSTADLPILPIVGIGGVGKTTLAQHICSDAQVDSHFDLIIWICVSDDFDVKRLTKEVIESCTGKQATTENLNALQKELSNIVSSNKFLIVLDDMWDDVLKENGQCWKRFCSPLKEVRQGSAILVTTRCPKVADRVGTRDPITLEGLNDDVFWNFFKLCVFESGSSNNNDPALECIGRSIVHKLKGSPLAAKTLGRILRMDLQVEHWNTILDSELWTLKQEDTEILPALRLSYMYLPFRLKRCFSLCALYPKDYRFEKGDLAEIWVAEGFVEPQGGIPLKDIGCKYFDDLLDRSFFQKDQSGYVIHDLLHDMAQKVSEDDCFILKTSMDFECIPLNVRHLSIVSITNIDYSDLLGLRHFSKLRTLLCNKCLSSEKTACVMADWCSKLLRLRVIVLSSIHELPASIGNLKHLRYFQIDANCRFKSLPAEFCRLHNLQILCLKYCNFERLSTDLSKLICLERFESYGFRCDSVFRRFQEKKFSFKFHDYQGVSLISFFYGLESSLLPRVTDLIIDGCENLSSLEHVIHPAYVPALKKMTIKNYKKLVTVPAERFGDLRCLEELEVQECTNIYSQSLVAPSLKRLLLGKENNWSGGHTCGNLAGNVDCSSLTYFFLSCTYPTSIQLHKWNLPALKELHISGCHRLTSIIGQSGQAIRGTSGFRAFPSLTFLTIDWCKELSTIDDLLAEEYLPAIKRIHIKSCHCLVSLPGGKFEKFSSLEELQISDCRRLSWGSGFVLPSSLQILSLKNHGDISAWIPSCLQNLSSLVTLKISYCQLKTSIPGDLWSTNLTSLENLIIEHCTGLVSIGGENAISRIKNVSIFSCPKLEELKQPILRGSYLVS